MKQTTPTAPTTTTTTPPREHTKDADCSLDDNDACVLCDVHHADPCYDCGQRGYHAATCPALAADRIAATARGDS